MPDLADNKTLRRKLYNNCPFRIAKLTAMFYNVKAREKLAAITAKLKQKQSVDPVFVAEVCKECFQLIEEYDLSPEKSKLAQSEFYNEFYQAICEYITFVNSTKTWLQAFNKMFILLPDIDDELEEIQSKLYEKISNNRFATLYRYQLSFTKKFQKMIAKQETGILTNTYIVQSVDQQLRYLSHHLMGNSNLTTMNLLQGKYINFAYQDFFDDLQAFLIDSWYVFDSEKREYFKELIYQVKAGVKLADEINWVQSNRHILYAVSSQDIIFDISYQIKKAITELAPGQSYLVPSGFWEHATVTEFKRINSGQVIIRVINTGAGGELYEAISNREPSRLFFPVLTTIPIQLTDTCLDSFIEKLIHAVTYGSTFEEWKSWTKSLIANKFFHEDEQLVDRQVNGTCSHSSLLGWFRGKVDKNIFLLFNAFVQRKAKARLEKYNVEHPGIVEVGKLIQAATKTMDDTDASLIVARNRAERDQDELWSNLSTLLQKKGKSLAGIKNLQDYFEKKVTPKKNGCKGLTEIELATVNACDSLPDDSYNNLSDRAKKAILVKKIEKHEAFLKYADNTLGVQDYYKARKFENRFLTGDKQVVSPYQGRLEKILDMLKTHNYVLNGGFGVEIDGKKYSHSAAFIYKTLVEMLQKKQYISFDEFMEVTEKISEQIRDKQKTTAGFFGLGSRDWSTSGLYEDVLCVLDLKFDPSVNVSDYLNN